MGEQGADIDGAGTPAILHPCKIAAAKKSAPALRAPQICLSPRTTNVGSPLSRADRESAAEGEVAGSVAFRAFCGGEHSRTACARKRALTTFALDTREPTSVARLPSWHGQGRMRGDAQRAPGVCSFFRPSGASKLVFSLPPHSDAKVTARSDGARREEQGGARGFSGSACSFAEGGRGLPSTSDPSRPSAKPRRKQNAAKRLGFL